MTKSRLGCRQASRGDRSTICFEVQESVALLTLNRPEKLNALSQRMAVEMWDALTRLGEASVLVVTGKGRAFSSGGDIAEYAEGVGPQEADPTMLDVLDRLAELPIPTLAAIEGHCLGGGLELALCCDLRVAGETAQLGLPEVHRGLLPGGGGTQRLPRLIGLARAKEMMLLGDPIDARTAERWGLVNRVVPAGSALDEAVGLASRLRAVAPMAAREIKRLANASDELELKVGIDLERAIQRSLVESADAQEGMRAFLERRRPKFRGWLR